MRRAEILERLADDLERVLHAEASPEQFRATWKSQDAASEIASVLANVEHYLADAAIRGRDPDYGDHGKLLKLVAKRITDRRVLKLLRQWLRAGWERMRGFLFKRKGRHLRAGESGGWTREFFLQQCAEPYGTPACRACPGLTPHP